MKKKRVVITGGAGAFAKKFKAFNKKFLIKFPTKYELNILNLSQIKNYIKKFKPDYLIHNAALSRPMDIHEKNINLSIKKNIIGTCNIVTVCNEYNVKLIYFSTNYVYPGKRGNYKETDPILPCNNYGWSKLGGECAVQMYKNSLILRLAITKYPFKHKKAYTNVKSSFIYYSDAASIVMQLINQKGVINIGGKSQTIFNFVKDKKKKIFPIIYDSKIHSSLIPKNSSLNLLKMKKLIKKQK